MLAWMFPRNVFPAQGVRKDFLEAVLEERPDLHGEAEQILLHQKCGLESPNGRYGRSSYVQLFSNIAFRAPIAAREVGPVDQSHDVMARLKKGGAPFTLGVLHNSPHWHFHGFEVAPTEVIWRAEHVPVTDVADSLALYIDKFAEAIPVAEAETLFQYRTGFFMQPDAGGKARLRDAGAAAFGMSETIHDLINECEDMAAARPRVSYHADLYSSNILLAQDRVTGRWDVSTVIDHDRVGIGPAEMALMDLTARIGAERTMPIYEAYARRTGQDAELRTLHVFNAVTKLGHFLKMKDPEIVQMACEMHVMPHVRELQKMPRPAVQVTVPA